MLVDRFQSTLHLSNEIVVILLTVRNCASELKREQICYQNYVLYFTRAGAKQNRTRLKWYMNIQICSTPDHRDIPIALSPVEFEIRPYKRKNTHILSFIIHGPYFFIHFICVIVNLRRSEYSFTISFKLKS